MEGFYVNAGLRELTFEQHEGQDFTVKLRQIRQPIDVKIAGESVVKSGWFSLGYELYMKDGTYYELDGWGRTTRMVDPTGKNVINFNYNGLVLQSITDSMGREVTFDYEWTWVVKPYISKIQVTSDPYQREVAYSHDTFGLLTSAVDAGGRVASYNYGSEVLFGGKAGATVDFLAIIAHIATGPFAEVAQQIFGPPVTLFGYFQVEWVQPLNAVTAPGQGKVAIGYDKPTFMYGDFQINWWWIIPVSVTISANLEQRLYTNSVVVYQAGASTVVRATNYSYTFSNELFHQPYVVASTASDGKRRTVYHYQPIEKRRSMWVDYSVPIEGHPISPGSFAMQQWRQEILSYNSQIDVWDRASGQLMEKTLFQNFDAETMRPLRQVTVRGANQRVVDFAYDNWGNLTVQKDTGGRYEDSNDDMETYSAYVNTNSTLNVPGIEPNPYTYKVSSRIHDRVSGRIVVAHTPVDANGAAGTVMSQTYYQYGPDSQVSEQAVWDGNKWLVSQYAYNQVHGAIAQEVKPDGSTTLYEYDANGFRSRVIHKDVTDARGNKSDIVESMAYEYISGWKLWDKNARGYVTEYTYDRLGRTIKTVYPNDDDDPNWDPRTGASTTRSNNPVNLVSFDDTAYDTTVLDALGHKTLYDYDSLGRLMRIIKYTKNGASYDEYSVTYLGYDDQGNITRIVDPNGHATEYTYDGAGKVTAMIYPDDTPYNAGDNPRKIFDREIPAHQGLQGDSCKSSVYGKTALVYEMLRYYLGAEKFDSALAAFYDRYKFSNASLADMEKNGMSLQKSRYMGIKALA